ncbi:MAG: 50S ribosomal protein L15 [bacterium]|nr:50S ribosomal protein L15 [bacterium]
MLHRLENAPGARKARKRVGRGPGSGTGKTSGRGHKGYLSRSGSKHRIGFEGGQMPLHMRLPKRGFTNIFRKEFVIVNLGDIAKSEKLDKSQQITQEALLAAGLIAKGDGRLKVLGNGEISEAIKIEAHKFSASAAAKINAAGGKAIQLES